MTISSETRKAGPFTCNGATNQFPFTFKVFAGNELIVVLTDSAGTEVTMVKDAEYSVSLSADQNVSPGGYVQTFTTFPVGYKVTVTSNVSATQEVDLTNQGGFYPAVINGALDRLTIICQQLKEQVGRAVKVGISSASTPEAFYGSLFNAADSAASSAAAAAASELNAAASEAYCVGVANSLTASEIAILTLNYKGLWSTLSGAISIPASVYHNGSYWMLLEPLANVAANEPTALSTKWTNQFIDAALVGYDNLSSGVHATNLQSAVDTTLNPNLIENWELFNCVRRYGTIPPQTYTSGQFVIDRWKAGSSGMTRFNHTQDITGAITVVSGSISQVVTGSFGGGQYHTLAWDGNAQCRINGGAYQSSPIVYTNVSPLNSITIEFGAGTFSAPRLVKGTIDNGKGRAKSFFDLKNYLTRYYQDVTFDRQAIMAAGETDRTTIGIQQMVSIPSQAVASITSDANISSFTTAATTSNLNIAIVATAAGITRRACTIKLDTGV